MTFVNQLLALTWRLENKWPLPIAITKNLESGEITELELIKYHFNWKLSEERYCPGFFRSGHQECRYKNKLEEGQRLCPDCESRLGFVKAFFFGEEPNEEMKGYLSQDHLIYLAYFPPGIIKVGTESYSRKSLRLIEQDALLGIQIARSDGFKIQELEHKISSELKYVEAVSSRHKYKYLGIKVERERGSAQLNHAHAKILNHFKETPYADWLVDNKTEPVNIIDNIDNPNIFYPEPERNIEVISEYTQISGIGKGLRGKFLFTEQNNKYYCHKASGLIGRKFYVEDNELIYPKSGQQQEQLSLFG